jgi:TRAP-type C4-dicarboxylate transport system permease small subunit
MLRQFDRGIVTATSIILVLLLVLMTGVILAGVFARYVMNDSLTWSEEVARYAMVWLSFLGGGLVFRHGGHIAIDMLTQKIPPGFARHAVLALSQLVILAFLGVLLWKGIEMLGNSGYMTTPALQLPMTVPYAAIPVGAALMIYHLVASSILAFVDGPRESLDIAPESRLTLSAD